MSEDDDNKVPLPNLEAGEAQVDAPSVAARQQALPAAASRKNPASRSVPLPSELQFRETTCGPPSALGCSESSNGIYTGSSNYRSTDGAISPRRHSSASNPWARAE